MSRSLAIEFTNESSGHGQFENHLVGNLYLRIPLSVDARYALNWLIENLSPNNRANYVKIGGEGAVRRIAATGETFVTNFAQAIVNPYH